MSAVSVSVSGSVDVDAAGSRRAWRWLIAATVALGFAVRVAAVLARPHLLPAGDPAEYLGQANLLAAGQGFIEPFTYAMTHRAAQTAKLPPLYIMVLALCSLAGFKGFLAHRIWSAIVGTAAVGLAAVVGRDLAGPRVGFMAAAVVAVYPNLWMSDALGMSETLSPVLVLVVLWAAYRMKRSPSAPRAAVVGAAVGLAALGRDELILLAPFVGLPLIVGAPDRSWRDRGRLAAAAGVAFIAVLGPWVGYNLTRFSRPVLITDRFGAALSVANCDPAWHGPLAGYWSLSCAVAAVAGVEGDESVQGAAAGRYARSYIGDHVGGVPAVELERLGRTFGFYRPAQQMQLDAFVEGRPKFWALTGLEMFYGLAVLAVAGAVRLRRRGVIIYPLVAVAATVVAAVLLTYGQTRFRASLEPVLVLLAAIAVDGLLSLVRPSRSDEAPAVGAGPRPALSVSRAPSDPN